MLKILASSFTETIAGYHQLQDIVTNFILQSQIINTIFIIILIVLGNCKCNTCLFYKLTWPVDSEDTFSAFQSSYHKVVNGPTSTGPNSKHKSEPEKWFKAKTKDPRNPESEVMSK